MLGRSSFLTAALGCLFGASSHFLESVPFGASGLGREAASRSAVRRGAGGNRHAQRVAAKKRAVARHRARSRGRA